MEERDFFTERAEMRPAQYTCPRCKRRNEYQVRWMRRIKKPRLPPGADARDRALYAKLRDYLIRMDDDVTCKTCGKRFEVPSHQSLIFVDEAAAARPAGQDGQDDDEDNIGNRA